MRFVCTTFLILMLFGCQTPMQKGSQCVVAPGFLAGQTTFTWRADKALDVDDSTGYISPLVGRALAQAVIAEMAGKGFEFVERVESDTATTQPRAEQQWADIELALTLRTRRELVSMSQNESPCVDTDCWERVDMGSNTRMDIRTIGFLAADVFYNDEPIWRGWVERNLYPKDRDATQLVIAESIPALFESFPP